MSFDVVVAADSDWGIGKHNALPWPRLKGDLQHFKRVTTDAPLGKRNAIVMGRRTWESKEVAGKPLPNRLNVVVTRRGVQGVDGMVSASSLDAALEAAKGSAGIFVVGGADLFRASFMHPELRWVYLTRVEGDFACDTQIPNLDQMFEREPWAGEGTFEDNGVAYRIEKMQRR
ncbi:MAG: dihydrofolate reductase-like [Myxococcales bacterium]|nr:dihydrofolate reductase-like [Myxococcales bacterium]